MREFEEENYGCSLKKLGESLLEKQIISEVTCFG